MSGDLHLHVFEGLTDDDATAWFAGNTVPSLYTKVEKSPNIWIGEGSWGCEEVPEFPRLLNVLVAELGQELPVLNAALTENILTLSGLKNTFPNYRVCQREDLEAFLKQHQGRRIFTVVW